MIKAKAGGGGSGGPDDGRRIPYAEEILVTKSDLEEKNTLMQELKSKVNELKLHNEYQLRLKDMDYNEKIKEVTEKFTQELEQNKNKYELLREEKNDMEMEYDEKIKLIDDRHVADLQKVEADYQQRIMAEVERYVLAFAWFFFVFAFNFFNLRKPSFPFTNTHSMNQLIDARCVSVHSPFIRPLTGFVT